MSYTLSISLHESDTLDWLAARGYFPETLARFITGELSEADELANGLERSALVDVSVPEHIAWSLGELRDEDPDAYLACLGGDLLERVLALESAIV